MICLAAVSSLLIQTRGPDRLLQQSIEILRKKHPHTVVVIDRFNSFKNERVHGVRYATHADMKAAASNTSKCFTIASGNIRPSVIDHESSILTTGSVSRVGKDCLHKGHLLEDEKQREPQVARG
jgi:hypothetical protein